MLEHLSYTFSFSPPKVCSLETSDDMFSIIEVSGCIELGQQPGGPFLPIRFIQVLLPPFAQVDSILVTGTPVELRRSGFDLSRNPIFPMQEVNPFDARSTSDFRLNQEVYCSHHLYPTLPYQTYHIGASHGYTILDMGLCPVQLIPVEGRVFYYLNLTVSITLREKGSLNPLFRGTSEDEAWVKALVCNPEMATRYASLPAVEYPGGLCDPSDQYDYVIITTEQNSLDHWDTSESTPYNWESLMQRHFTEGLSCTLVTTQEINACPDYYNATLLFNDSQAHIREFCKDAYQDWGTQYVLLGADAEFIPARLMSNEYEYNVDSDLYWSNLDNSFNADHDSLWGEEGDSGFDAYSELFIGRIPCDIPLDVSNWLTKSFSYADSVNPDSLENGGFFAANISWGIQGDDIIDFAAIKGTDGWLGSDPGQWPEWLGFLYGFETWNIIHPDASFNLSVRWTYDDPNPGWQQGDAVEAFRSAINNNSVTLITGIGHADSEMSLDVYSSEWATLYHNTMPFFIIDLGCHCGDIDGSDDGVLGTMLFSSDSALAFGCLYSSGYTWSGVYDTNSSDALQTKLFWDYFFDLTNNSGTPQCWRFGKALAWSKDNMAPTLNWGFSWRGTIQDRLLFADPAQLLKPPKPLNNPPGVPTLVWDPVLGLYMTSIDPEGDDVFYQVDWGDGSSSEWLGPYQSGMSAHTMHTWASPGSYLVKAHAKDIYNTTSDWSDPLLVEVHEPLLEIDSITGGFGVFITLKNAGEEYLKVIGWNITLNGGLILLGKYRIGLVPSLPVGESETVKSFVLGLGKTTIKVHAWSSQGATAEKSAPAFILGPFAYILK